MTFIWPSEYATRHIYPGVGVTLRLVDKFWFKYLADPLAAHDVSDRSCNRYHLVLDQTMPLTDLNRAFKTARFSKDAKNAGQLLADEDFVEICHDDQTEIQE